MQPSKSLFFGLCILTILTYIWEFDAGIPHIDYASVGMKFSNVENTKKHDSSNSNVDPPKTYPMITFETGVL